MGGIAYVLTNPAIWGLVKIGKTNRYISSRPADLYRKGVALSFACLYAGIVKDVDRLKRHFTKHLNQEEIILKENFLK